MGYKQVKGSSTRNSQVPFNLIQTSIEHRPLLDQKKDLNSEPNMFSYMEMEQVCHTRTYIDLVKGTICSKLSKYIHLRHFSSSFEVALASFLVLSTSSSISAPISLQKYKKRI